METQVKKLTRKEKIAAKVEKPKGNRKWRAAQERKELTAGEVRAELNDYPSSPQKMRLVCDQIRGKNVGYALSLLRLSPRAASEPLRKLLLSAYDNWQQKFPEDGNDLEQLYVAEVFVDGGAMLKRLRPAPQGRAFRVRKRSNHVTIKLGLYEDLTPRFQAEIKKKD